MMPEKDKHAFEDIDLIRKLKNGEIKSFERLFNKYYPRFHRFVLGFVGEDAAEDILQNVFMKVWTHRDTLDENLSMVAYLYVLSKNEIYSFFRSKHNNLVDRFSERMPEDIYSYPGVEEEYDLTELNETIQKVIDAMPEKRREIFKMNRYEFMSAKEIAERTGLSVRTVEKHIELALKDIRAKVSPFSFLLFLLFNLVK